MNDTVQAGAYSGESLLPTLHGRSRSDAIGNGFKQPDMQAKILKLEANPLGSTPDEMRKQIQESLDIWGPVVQQAKISVD